MTQTKKKRPFQINREKRKARRNENRRIERVYGLTRADSEITQTNVIEQSQERAEALSIVRQMTRAYIDSIEYYKADYGGSHSHDEAVKKNLSMNEWRRDYVKNLPPEKVNWSHLSAVGEADLSDALTLWRRVREAADDELESGKRAAAVAGNKSDAYAVAQFMAIRDSFADQWQPNGGIEAAMIDMLAIAFSLQMYWTTIAHQRSVETHNKQQKEIDKFETQGWKSPYQYEADAINQANRLADSYNRQFLRVLRQLRDLRRYSPVIIQNNGGQVNIGEQQVNVQKSNE